MKKILILNLIPLYFLTLAVPGFNQDIILKIETKNPFKHEQKKLQI